MKASINARFLVGRVVGSAVTGVLLLSLPGCVASPPARSLPQALIAAQRLYGDMHPNTAFAHTGLGLSLVRTGVVRVGSRHLRESRQIETRYGDVFVNIAESRLPADSSDPIARTLLRMRLRRDLVLCGLDGGCRPTRVLDLAEALRWLRR